MDCIVAAWSVLIVSGSVAWVFARERRLRRRRREQTAFYASLGHELKTPLNGIIGFAELLTLEKLSGDQREYVQNIDFSAHALLRMIDNMLDCAKLNAGEMRFYPRPVDVGKLANELPAMLQALLMEKNLQLVIDCPVSIPAFSIDPDRLRQIFLNLVGNAIKYSERGVITLKIEPPGEGGELKFSVTDQGAGIPEENRKRIFDPFVRQEQHAAGGNGTGLGLYITMRLIRLMHGSIALDSQVGQGSRFSVTIPDSARGGSIC